MEYLLVRYYRRRSVMVKDRVIGYANELIEIEGGKYTVTMSPPPNYRPDSYDIVIREKRVVGTRALTRMEFREVVALVNSGAFVPDIGELVPIGRVNEAFDNLRQGRYLTRTVLTLPF